MSRMDIRNFSRRVVITDVITEIECDGIVNIVADKITEWKSEYLLGNIGKKYDSKTIRVQAIDDVNDLAVSLILSTFMIGENTLQSLCSHFASSLKYDDQLDSLKTATEIVCYCNGIVYDIHKPSIANEHAMYSVTPKYRVSDELMTRISKCFFLPPSVEMLDAWTNNHNGGYDFAKSHAILGDKFNEHDKPLNLHVLNVLQDVKYELVPEIVSVAEEAKDEWEGEQLEAFELAQKQSRYVYDLIDKDAFSFVWNYDKRGRIYSRGYDINVQGNSYRKAMLRFAKKEVLTDRGIYWLKVDIANCYGLDKLNYNDRVSWVDDNISEMLSDPEPYYAKADEPLLLKRALIAYKEGVVEGKPIGHICQLDATCSGAQIMSVASRCKTGMKALNCLDDGKRHDFYTEVTEALYAKTKDSGFWKGMTNFSEIRKNTKAVIMTSLYNSKAKPEEFFGKDSPELTTYYETLEECAPGAWKLMHQLNGLWSDDRETNEWSLPDGHTAYCPVTKLNRKRIETDELGFKAKFAFLVREHMANKEEYRSLAVNVVHSLDGWICRQIVFQLADYRIEVSPIHDSFGVHPNYCDTLRQVYKGCLARLYREDIISNIASEITGEQVTIERNEFDKEVYSSLINNIDGYYIC